jgi:predicted phosphodiesterase
MRVALLSDIHGNSIALDAVLEDVEKIGVDAHWILGDVVALGHDPVGVLERIVKLPNACFIRGNTDRYVVTGDRPPPYAGDVVSDPKLLTIFEEIAGSFAWTLGAVAVNGWLDWLAELPLELKLTLPDGSQFLGVHASYQRDDGMGISPDTSEEEFRLLMDGCEADLICVGHTHLAVNRRVDHWHVVNVGSVSNPRFPDLRACYAILDCTSSGYSIDHRRVEYDRGQVIAQLEALKHPARKFIARHMLGQIK